MWTETVVGIRSLYYYTNNFKLTILLVMFCIRMVVRNSHSKQFSINNLSIVSTMVFAISQHSLA